MNVLGGSPLKATAEGKLEPTEAWIGPGEGDFLPGVAGARYPVPDWDLLIADGQVPALALGAERRAGPR